MINGKALRLVEPGEDSCAAIAGIAYGAVAGNGGNDLCCGRV